MENFYVTLPSNTVTDNNNTPSQFTVHLPQKIELVGEWECGLCQVIYPHTWENLNQENAEIRFQLAQGNSERSITFPPGCYDSIQDLLAAIQASFKNETEHHEKVVTLTYDNISKRVYLKIIDPKIIEIVAFTERLASMLGFKERLHRFSKLADMEPDLKLGFDAMYIYCNILEHQIVGDIAAPLLRIVTTEGKYPDVIDKAFDLPHYVPVLVKSISDIQINIKDDLNQYINFHSGKTIIKIHFRRIKQPYF